jgi:hypothetical protein
LDIKETGDGRSSNAKMEMMEGEGWRRKQIVCKLSQTYKNVPAITVIKFYSTFC